MTMRLSLSPLFPLEEKRPTRPPPPPPNDARKKYSSSRKKEAFQSAPFIYKSRVVQNRTTFFMRRFEASSLSQKRLNNDANKNTRKIIRAFRKERGRRERRDLLRYVQLDFGKRVTFMRAFFCRDDDDDSLRVSKEDARRRL